VAVQRETIVMSRKTRNILLIVLAVPILIVIVLLLFAEWMWGGRVQTSLDPQYVPTAQYLVEHPEPMPGFINVYPRPGSTIQSGDMLQAATNAYRLAASEDDIADWTRIYVNNVRLENFRDVVRGMGGPLMPPDETYDPTFFFSPPLQPGFHLIEIRVGTSITALLNPSEARTYTWAYQVE
jgi:hypothetical protein